MNKWAPDVDPSDPVADAAAQSLQARFDAVRHYLRQAIECPERAENFHQLRVWTRRSEAALALYADLLPDRLAKWLRKWLKRLRRAAGRVRDCDVFAARTIAGNGRWPKKLRAERARAVAKTRKLDKRLDGGRRLRRQARKLLGRLRAQSTCVPERFAERARRALQPLVAAMFGAVPADVADAAAFHQFRIRGKELRYAMELLAGAFPPAFRIELYPVVGVLQEKLGLINDLAVARRRLQERMDQTGDPAELSALRREEAATGEDQVRAREDFIRWWTPEARDGLRSQFDDMLVSPTAPR
jgi:CHAD domain-containing protein